MAKDLKVRLPSGNFLLNTLNIVLTFSREGLPTFGASQKQAMLIQILTIIGALGFFIYGMKVMSEGIQKVAGSRMRQILGAMTSNRFKGILAGFLITSLIQSSSATTVMVVSFVNAGLLSLVESIGVIMGANIGTTVTAWLVSLFGFKFKIAAFALPLIAVGFPLLFFNREKLRSLGEFLIGFALLFLGLEELKDAVPDLNSNPEILEFLANYTGMGMLSTIIFVMVGTLLTVIVQSSSAAMTLTLTLLFNGIIPLEVGAAMVLGENIGTTITANLAALVANVHAKRAARAHFIFNIFGVIWMILAFPIFIQLVGNIWEPVQTSLAANGFDLDKSSEELQLSLFHTLFNIINTFLLVWFVPIIAKAVIWMVPSRGDDEEFHLEFIGRGITQTPELSLLEAKKEIAKFGKIVKKQVSFVQEVMDEKDKKRQKKLIEKIAKYEEITDRIEAEVVNYLTQLSKSELTSNSSARVRGMLNMVNELESIGDICFQMSKNLESKFEKKIWFSQNQRNSLKNIYDAVDAALENMNNNLEKNHEQVSMKEAIELEGKINKERDAARKSNFEQIEKAKIKPPAGFIFNDLLASYEKIGDHVFRVSEAVTGVNVE